MKYLLKNKNKVVLEFEVALKHSNISNNFEEYAENIIIKDKNLLPISMDSSDIQKNLLQWIKKRKAPTNRSYIKKIIATYKDNTSEEKIMDYVNISFALSLNDSYWITPADKKYSWQKYNLYTNDFEKSLELAAFGILSQKVSGFTSSPEYTTNGMLPKCWHRENSEIYLYKGSSKNYENGEVYSEYYMSQVAKLLDFSHAHYDLKMFHNRLVSTCPIFTNENEGYMPIGYCIDPNIRKEKGFMLINEVKKIYGKDSLQDLMLFDALICNIDRHLGNFGMIIDNNTNEILRPAPIFDNGLSMMTTLSAEELRDDKGFLGFEKSAFEISFNNQLEYSIQPRHIPNLEKLQSFEFQKHKKFNLPDEWLESIQKAIQDRAKLAIDFCYKKQSKTIATDKIRAMPKPSAEIDAKGKEFLNAAKQTHNNVIETKKLQIYTVLKYNEIKNLKKITQKEYANFVDDILSGDMEKLKKAPNVIYVGNLSQSLAQTLGIPKTPKTYLRKNDLHHFRPKRKEKYNQSVEKDIIKRLPLLIENAKEAYIDSEHRNFFLTQDLNKKEVVTFHLNADRFGNYIITTRKVLREDLNKYQLVGSGIEPHIKRINNAALPTVPSPTNLDNDTTTIFKSQTNEEVHVLTPNGRSYAPRMNLSVELDSSSRASANNTITKTDKSQVYDTLPSAMRKRKHR